MSLRQLRTRIEHLEHLNNKKRSPSADWEERERQWRQTKGLNEVERPLTEEEKAEYDELMYRFHPLGASLKAWEEALKASRSSRERRPRPNGI
jgi:hypothetical protein